MVGFKKWLRLTYIIYILSKYNVIEKILRLSPRLSPLRILRMILMIRPSSIFWFVKKNISHAEQTRIAFETLGPIFIKVGQALSTRRDLLSKELADELARLQDRVISFSGEEAIKLVEKSLGESINTSFLQFNIHPTASASIAQVHSAILQNGKNVVVKVLRPNISKILLQDIALLKTLARILEKWFPSTRRLRPVEVIDEISQNLTDELDLQREAANASQLRRNFKNSKIHYVPEVYWQYCRKDLLTIEKIEGVPISDITTLKSLNINLKLLAERGVEIFYTQVFRDCFFHADMHPGNIFVDIKNPRFPKYISVDFGIVGTLNKDDQHYLAGNFLAFFNRDYRRVSELHVESGWVPYNTRIDELESAIRTVCEPIFEKSLAEISFGHTLLNLFQVARRFNVVIQPQLILLQKTLLNIEGLGRNLYPELNLWETAKPFLEGWMKRQFGWKSFVKRSAAGIPRVSKHLPELPEKLIELLNTKAVESRIKRNSETILDKERNVNKSRNFHIKKHHIVISWLGGILLTISIIHNLQIDLIQYTSDHYDVAGLIGTMFSIYVFFQRK